ncbi:MAG: LPS export ABC transporter periplasmic protein LptC [Alphaproteobacteria bacterium]
MNTPATRPRDVKSDGNRVATSATIGGGNGSGSNYSRFVVLMKIGLPVTAAAIVALVIAWPQLMQKPKGFRLGVSKITVHDTGGQQIVNPRFSSTDTNQRPFNLTADTAYQHKDDPNLVDLAFPKADLTGKAGSWMAISAKTGLFNRQSEMLDLKGAISLFHDSGYELKTTIAQINLAAGTAKGDVPISGHGPGGTVKGSGFRILERGKTMIFTGKSKMVLYPTSKQLNLRRSK